MPVFLMRYSVRPGLWRAVRLLLLLTSLHFAVPAETAAQQVLPPTIHPAILEAGVPTPVTVTALVTTRGPQVLPASVNLLSVDSRGRVLRLLGTLSDTGMAGDVSAGDGIFSGSTILTGDLNAPFYLQVSAAFRGVLRRSLSPVVTLQIASVGTPLSPPPLRPSSVMFDVGSSSFFVCDEALVQFSPDATEADIQAALATVNGVLSGRIPELQYHVIGLPLCDTAVTLSAVQSLRQNSFVLSADADYARELHSTVIPNDPRFPNDWALQRVNAPRAWAIQRRGVPIGVVDTGVRYSHEEISGHFTLGLDQCDHVGFLGCVRDPDPWDDSGHGTFVASIAAARANNHRGLAGVAFDAFVIVEKVFANEPCGLEELCSTDKGIAGGIIDAVKRGARVINLSLGRDRDSAHFRAAVKFALDRHIVVVASAGNDNTNAKSYPAAIPGVISVGAIDQTSRRARWSKDVDGDCVDLNKTSQASNYGNWVDVYAPGSYIDGAFITDDFSYTGVLCAGGTSSAAPFVAGAVSLLLAKEPALTPSEVKDRIKRTAQSWGHVDPDGNDIKVLDVFGALLGTPQPVTTAVLTVKSNTSTSWTIRSNILDSFANGSGLTAIHTVTPALPMETFALTPTAIAGYTFSVTNSDGGGAQLTISPGQTKSFTITYSAIPSPVAPVARDDSYTMNQFFSLEVSAPGVLLNDTVPAGNISVEFLGAQTGTMSFLQAGIFFHIGNGGFSLNPRPDLFTVSFQYVLHTSSGSSNIATVTVQIIPAPVPAPTMLAAFSPFSGQVSLTWVDRSLIEARFDVSRNGVVLQDAIGRNHTSLTLYGLDPSVEYSWDIRACSTGTCSPWHGVVVQRADGSDHISIEPTPTNLSASSPSVGLINLTWTDESTSETGFEVSQNGTVLDLPIGQNQTFVSIREADLQLPYSWDVRACNDAGCSQWHGPVARAANADNPLGGGSGIAIPLREIHNSNQISLPPNAPTGVKLGDVSIGSSVLPINGLIVKLAVRESSGFPACYNSNTLHITLRTGGQVVADATLSAPYGNNQYRVHSEPFFGQPGHTMLLANTTYDIFIHSLCSGGRAEIKGAFQGGFGYIGYFP